ncbi:restriction endonuclease subunit S [Bowmanella yangjiangensis]|uniref:Restriction endonuclease subunit S n=1 Tax=Bowmanella yangjiangensis TaxID=2811230 RepID=A0ABS3CTW6_9ALTE|nr:restriction endonuclease subunit S [Bowmanella yangjiangensis]MBN7820505.1 restriction endonuclease subunit S [Bowmanella yangjiangensis]
MVPKGWSVKTLGDLTHYSAFGPRFSSDLYSENGNVGTIRTTDLNDEGEINYSTIPYANVPDSFKSHFLDDGDLLITRSGSCGIPCIFVRQDKPVIAGAFLIRFVLNEKADATFLHALLKSEKVQIKIQNLASGGVQKNLSGTNLKKLELLVPPLPEQKKIAQILSTWDKAITTTEQLLANSQQQKKALMQQLLTGKKRLLDKNGVRFSGEWKWLKASELFKTVSTKNNSETEELLAVTQDLGVLPRSLLERRVVMPDGSTKGYKLVVPGNFIISLRSFQGGLEYSSYRGLVSPAYTVLAPIKTINDEFFKHYYKSYDFIGHLAVAVIGIRDGKQISYSDFSFLKLPYPSLEEQQKIAAALSNADQGITALQQKLDALKQEKKALMQQLLTGKRRVKVEEAA